jgi:hypothetical protein
MCQTGGLFGIKKAIRRWFKEKLSLTHAGKEGDVLIYPEITPDGDKAKGKWLFYMMYAYPRTAQALFWVQGFYENEYVRENGRWKVSLMTWNERMGLAGGGPPLCRYATLRLSPALPCPESPSSFSISFPATLRLLEDTIVILCRFRHGRCHVPVFHELSVFDPENVHDRYVRRLDSVHDVHVQNDVVAICEGANDARFVLRGLSVYRPHEVKHAFGPGFHFRLVLNVVIIKKLACPRILLTIDNYIIEVENHL